MSRKSKETIIQERLEQISRCPVDLFKKINPSDEIFKKIEAAEQGDISLIKELCALTYETYMQDCAMNQAMLYYAELGKSHGDLECTLTLIRCIERFNERYDLLDSTLSIINGKISDSNIERLITRTSVQRILAEARRGADYIELTERLSTMYDEYAAYARIYLASRRLAETGSYNKSKIDSLAAALDIPSILTLPVFTGNPGVIQKIDPTDVKKECEAISFALSLIHTDEWQDFWLKTMYEYSQVYLGSDLSVFAVDMLNAILGRCEYPEKKLHVLAIKKYLVDIGKLQADEYKPLLEECIFDGFEVSLTNDELRDTMIKDAVYTDSKEKRQKLCYAMKLGTEILHTKNRYLIRAELNNHMKRGTRHMWDITLSIKTNIDAQPTINTCRIGERKNQVCRNGIKLEKERKLSQMFCMGEIHLGEKAYPLEYDLILDISYVSSTKCEYCEVKIKDYHREGEHLVLDSTIIIH